MTMSDFRPQEEYFGGNSVFEYLRRYTDSLSGCVEKLSRDELGRAVEAIEAAAANGRTLYVAGNGGSAAVAQHLCCDWMKGTWKENFQRIKVHALTANQSLFSALANDYGYEHVFSAQIEMLAERGDVGIFISSSGNSPNILRGIEAAKEKGLTTIGLSGFEGGRLRELADIKLHVSFHNYGLVEDLHQILMHVLAQSIYLRRKSK